MQMQGPKGEERRRFSRIAFHRPAELTIGEEAVACRILDLSLNGALLEVPGGLPGRAHQHATLDIQLDALAVEHIQMEGELAHVEGDHIGFTCDEIDLDSITHLRRLVELNLGDEELLHRELGALIAAHRH